jgi:hypothetical protein
MGYYINPPDQTKEDWLQEHGDEVGTPSWPAPDGSALVCLIDNGPFSAAGICFSEQEFQAFVTPDGRPRTWYYVPSDKVISVEPLVKDLLNV